MYATEASSNRLVAPKIGPTLGDQISSIRGDVQELCNRLCSIANRVSGSVPSPVGETNPTSHCHMAELMEIRKELSDLREQVNRLDNVL